MITVKRDIELELSPHELAEEIWEKNCEEQAVFFNELGRHFSKVKRDGITQLYWIVTRGKLDDKGKWFIKRLSEILCEIE